MPFVLNSSQTRYPGNIGLDVQKKKVPVTVMNRLSYIVDMEQQNIIVAHWPQYLANPGN